jgi:hypothetical protein
VRGSQDISDALPPPVLPRDASGALPLSDANRVAARWALLIDDPWFELRVAGQQAPTSSALSFGALPQQAVLQRLDQMPCCWPPANDQTVRFWNPDTATEVAKLLRRSTVMSVAAARSLLAFGDNEGTP